MGALAVRLDDEALGRGGAQVPKLDNIQALLHHYIKAILRGVCPIV